MPFVSRDDNGRINGVFANAQPGFAEEWLDEDNEELQAFLNPPTRVTVELPDTSPTTLNADPIGEMDAVTRRYVDEQIAELRTELLRSEAHGSHTESAEASADGSERGGGVVADHQSADH